MSKKNRSSGKANVDRGDETLDKKDNLSTSKITFSFVNFLGKDTKEAGQTWDEWHEKNPKMIVDLLKKFKHLGTLNTNQAKEEKSLSVYGPFPPDSKFKCPEHLKHVSTWGVIRRFSGLSRVPGFYDGQGVFNIVFLDQNHEFWPSER